MFTIVKLKPLSFKEQQLLTIPEELREEEITDLIQTGYGYISEAYDLYLVGLKAPGTKSSGIKPFGQWAAEYFHDLRNQEEEIRHQDEQEGMRQEEEESRA
jgi:hypothetical protein